MNNAGGNALVAHEVAANALRNDKHLWKREFMKLMDENNVGNGSDLWSIFVARYNA